MFCMTIAPPVGDGPALDHCIARIAGGEREALAELYHGTRSAVYGFALSLVKNAPDAEDVLQDTYLKVWQGAGLYRSQGKPMAWLLTIVRNLAMSRLRDQGRVGSIEELTFTEPAAADEDRLVLESLLTVLEDRERQIVVLHALSGLKHREIAALLEMPLATVLSKYSRALKKLRNAWKEG